MKKIIKKILQKYLILKNKKSFKSFITKYKKSIFFIGTPTHTNLGDSAIAIAEKVFVKSLGYRTKEITFNEYNTYSKLINKHIEKSGNIVLLIGGGNMGNQWFNEELFRRQLLKNLENSRIIIFPQTIYYTPDEKGEKEMKASVDFYNDKQNLTLVAREKTSFKIMKELYPQTKILFTPDIVLSINPKVFNIEKYDRTGVLFIMRNDAERSMNDTSRERLIDKIEKMGLSYAVSDMHSDKSITKENRFEIVREKLNEFAAAKLVITDRLHGMIFAAVTGTPCIVFSNYNYKVKGTYEWISYLPYIRYVDSVEDAEKLIPELIKIVDCKYDNTPLMPYFEELKKVIKTNA